MISKINLPARASMAYLGASFIGKAIGLLTTPFFTRLVSEEEYGTLTLYMTILGASSIICSSFSSGSAIYRGLSKFDTSSDGFIKSALWGSMGFSTAFCLLLFTFWHYIGLPRLFMLPLAIQILCDSVVGVSLAKARYKYGYLEVMIIGVCSSALPPLISIWILTQYDATFGVRIYLLLAISLIISTVQFIRIDLKSDKASLQMLKFMLASALPLLPHSISVAISGQADKLFVARLMGEAALAKYSVVHSLGIALQFAVTSLGSALGPWIIRRLNAGEEGRVKSVITILFALFSALSLGLCSVAPEAMRLLAPEKYREALPALFPIAISTPLCLISYVITLTLVHKGRGKYTAFISGASLFLCILLNSVLISRNGYLGAGLALFLSQLGAVSIGYFLLRSADISEIFDIKRISFYLTMSIIIGFVTDLLYTKTALRLLVMTIPAIWGFSILLRCRDLVLEKGKSQINPKKIRE